MATIILKQLSKLNQFIVNSILILVIILWTLRLPAWLTLLLPVSLAFLQVYIFKFAPSYPYPRRKLGYYAGHVVMVLATGLIILSVALPVLWSTLADDPNFLMLLWAVIPAFIFALPGWGIGTLLLWLCGTRHQPAYTA